MTYWKNCIIHLCAVDNGIMQEGRDKGRENKCNVWKWVLWTEQWKGDGRTFSLCAKAWWFRADYWSLHVNTEITSHHNRASEFSQLFSFLFPHLSQENPRRPRNHFIFQFRKPTQKDIKQLVCHGIHAWLKYTKHSSLPEKWSFEFSRRIWNLQDGQVKQCL